jgi:hypothetical protein
MEHLHLPATSNQPRDNHNHGQGSTHKAPLRHHSNKQPMAAGGPSPIPMPFHLLVQLQHRCRDIESLKNRFLFLPIRLLDLLSSEMRINNASWSNITLLRSIREHLSQLQLDLENVGTITCGPLDHDVKIWTRWVLQIELRREVV